MKQTADINGTAALGSVTIGIGRMAIPMHCFLFVWFVIFCLKNSFFLLEYINTRV